MVSGLLQLNEPSKGQFAHFQKEQPITASVWFGERFPLALKHGVPFVELKESSFDGFSRITPICINIDFFAQMLGGNPKLGHSVIYYEPDMQFYYFEPMEKVYKPTSPEKLQNLYRAMLMKCAQEIPEENNKLNLCVEFRKDTYAKSVVQRAKSVLAADSSFFSPTSPHTRIKGVEVLERVARHFVDSLLTAEPGQILKLQEAYSVFRALLKQRNLPDIQRGDFKAVVAPLIRDQFNCALRNDLQIEEKTGQRGWKNMKLAQSMPAQ